MGFGLICRTWAFLITHNRPLGPADWAIILHPGLASKGPGCFNGHASPLGFRKWAYHPIFQTLSIPPSPCVRRAWARAVTFLVSDAISTCLLEVGLVKA